MNNSVVFNADTLRILRQLSPSDRSSITSALMNRVILGDDINDSLSPMQSIVYGMLLSNIERASARYARANG